jgi:hypothetical protein
MRFLLGLAATLLATLVLAAVFIAFFGWNWLRAPLERVVLQKTGRELAIHGDLTVKFGWPQVRLHGATLTFANPAWTQERYMVAATSVEVAVDVPATAAAQPHLPRSAPAAGHGVPGGVRRRAQELAAGPGSSRTRTPASASGASRWTAPS